MPLSTEALYLHLNMNAEDDGFVGSPKKIVRMINAGEDDFKLLLAKRFILGFNSGIIVIKHWKMNNYIRSDRYKTTVYQEELKSLKTKENGSYTELSTIGIPSDNHLETQVRLGKDSIGKDRLGNIIAVYEQEIGLATQNTIITLESYLDDLSDEMIIEAIKRASSYNKRSLSYIEAILKNWINNGYKTLGNIKENKQAKHEETNEERVKRLFGG
jgi:DnaD/phage-associated family protein